MAKKLHYVGNSWGKRHYTATPPNEHPVSVYLQQLIKDYDLKHADLVNGDRLYERFGIDPAYALKVDQSHVSRILSLKESDRPSIGLLSDLFCLLSEIAFSQEFPRPSLNDTSVIDIFESWDNFLSRRGNAVFYELARHLGRQTDRPNPARHFLTKNDEVEWQRSHVPQERWIVTDTLEESACDVFLKITTNLIEHKKLKRLIYFMPNSEESERQFMKMCERIENELDSKKKDSIHKIHCLLLSELTPKTTPLMQMRLDDPNRISSPLHSGVQCMGTKHNPEVIVLSEAAIMQITSWLQPEVQAMINEDMANSINLEGIKVLFYSSDSKEESQGTKEKKKEK